MNPLQTPLSKIKSWELLMELLYFPLGIRSTVVVGFPDATTNSLSGHRNVVRLTILILSEL